MEKTSQCPEVKNYLDVHDYLKAIYNFRKSQELDFSYEKWSIELGINNKSFLRRIIIGQRSLTETTTNTFCDNLNLNKSDREYFHLLVLYSKTSSVEKKDLYGRRLRQLIRNDYQQEEVLSAEEFILMPLYPRLQTILGFTDIEKTPESLASLLKVSVPELKAALQVLQDLGLAAPTSNLDKIQWMGKTKAFKVPDNLGSKALLKFHEHSLKDAIQAQDLNSNQRRYHSLLVPLSEETFQNFIADLQGFIKQTLSKYDSQELLNHQLFQINLNLHAVSHVERPENTGEKIKGQSHNQGL